MSNGEFFQEQQEHSFIKALIVKKYFWSWANVMLAKAKTDRICYIKTGPDRSPPPSSAGKGNRSSDGWRDKDYVCAND